MAVIDLVKWDGSPDILAWKFPSTELSTWTQLVVNESQEAFVVHGGVYDGPFGAGRHTLTTENIPVIRKFMGLPFGGTSPFTAEAWFVNKTINLSIRWGTPDPIQLEDPKYQLMIPVRAFGQYGVQVSDSKKFLLKLVGTLRGFDVEILNEYFAGVFTTRIKQLISSTIIESKISVLEISPHLESLSTTLQKALASDLDEYGLSLTQFNINSINVPEDDPAVISLKTALAKRAELGILGFTYQQERSFDVLQTAAGNEGTAGGVMGAGIGFGVGLGIGPAIGQMAGPGGLMNTGSIPAAAQDTSTQPIDGAEKIRLLKELAELKNAGILTEEEFNSEKAKLLGA
jgi:membrane protease subunit (stomatin/prohibitin family)